MQYLFTLEHAAQIEECRSLCLQAITWAKDSKNFRSKYYFMQNSKLTEAYSVCGLFPKFTPAWRLCHKACKEAQRVVNEQRISLFESEQRKLSSS